MPTRIQFRKLTLFCATIVFFAGSSFTSSAAHSAVATVSIPHKSISRHQTSIISPVQAPLGVMDTAMQFVLVTGIHKNLSLLLLHEVKNEQPVQDAITRYGMDKVQATVVSAIRAAKGIHAPEWNEMLAAVYKQHFTDEELRSILEDREASPHFGSLIDKQAIIAEEAQLKGKEIFSSAEADVLKRVSAELPL